MNGRFKEIVRDLTPPYFLKIALRIYRGKYLASDQLDKKLQKYLNYDNGFFVELGANDGMVASNTYYFEKHKKWRGVLIEPCPNKFIECKKNRSVENTFFCAACVSFGFSEEFVKMAYSDYMSSSLNVESDVENPWEHAKWGEKYLSKNENVFVFGAKAETLNNLLLIAPAPVHIDFLSLDVEGAELEVLKGVDHDKFRFKYMLVECRNFDRLNDFLEMNRYSFLEKLSKHDYLFKSQI
jgi:FkbM family methyltransferase